MGVQGLRKFVDGSSCTKSLSVSTTTVAAPRVEHVLFDMNSIVHSCFSKNHASPKETIQAVIERLTVMVTRVIVPTKSLTLCFDGPAPVAKLQTQRMRRRKVGHMDIGNNKQFSDLAITTGSLFMVELENRLAVFFKSGTSLLQPVPVYVFGSTCIGEGEAKIAQALAFHASDRLRYRTGDLVVVVGNDIDLTLTCLGATQYHNLFVVGPSSLQVIAVGDLISRWLVPSSAFLTDVAQLPSTRIDLVFLFLLNGGDHYVGLGEVAVDIWKRYRLIRTQQPYRGIVSEDLLSIDVGFLSDVLQVSAYTGNADPESGAKLLKAALWSTYMTVTGVCPNFHFVHDDLSPSLSNLKAALATRAAVSIHISTKPPLSPLATFVALMPSLETLPDSIRRVILKRPMVAKRLRESNEPRVIAAAATEAVEGAKELGTLSKADEFLCNFSTPVHINFVPKTKHMSRNEQHRLLAKTGSVEVAPSPPEVVPITCPENFHYQCSVYKVRELVFRNPFGDGSDRKYAVDPAKLGLPAEDAAAGASEKRPREDDASSADEDNAADNDELLRFLGDDASTLNLNTTAKGSAQKSKKKRITKS